MRRENRKNNTQSKTLTDKIIMYGGIALAILAIIVLAIFLYSKNLSDDVKNSTINLERMANIANNSQNNVENQENNNTTTQSTSTEIGKSVEESSNEQNAVNNSTNNTNGVSNNKNNSVTNNNIENKTNTTNNMKNVNNSSTQKNTTTLNTTNQTNTSVQTSTSQETQKELKFQKPVEGDIVREYAKENLIYSETLQEWTTHTGIDIKAEKTTVVNSAEEGTVKSIKNDPRYGLTVVVEHENNFQTVYSNLLTAEFIVEGEKVEKGQAIGTVGNTGVFEIVDEPHLHFEIIKDSLPVDPSLYLN